MINNTHVQALSTETHHEYRKPPYFLSDLDSIYMDRI